MKTIKQTKKNKQHKRYEITVDKPQLRKKDLSACRKDNTKNSIAVIWNLKKTP